MAAWHLAPALTTFIRQFNAAFPNRDTRSDGTIGDLRHQHEVGGSDHNPDATGTVCAFDGTHGPYWHASLADANLIANELVASGDDRINYVIFNRRIWTRAKGWHDYPSPPNASPHLEHFHLSVNHGASANDGSEWDLPSFGLVPTVSVADIVATHDALTTPTTTTPIEDDDVPQFLISDGTNIYLTDGMTKAITPALDEDFYRGLVMLGQAKNAIQPDGNVSIATNPDYLSKIKAA